MGVLVAPLRLRVGMGAGRIRPTVKSFATRTQAAPASRCLDVAEPRQPNPKQRVVVSATYFMARVPRSPMAATLTRGATTRAGTPRAGAYAIIVPRI